MSFRRVICLAGVISIAVLAHGQSAPCIKKLEADGHNVPVEVSAAGTPSPVGITSGALTIQFAPAEGEKNELRRFRYKLDGFDKEWRETMSTMRLVMVFYDKDGNFISDKQFIVKGESRKWNESVHNSPLMTRVETALVPNRAVQFSIILTSAGSPSSVGTIAIGALKVSGAGKKSDDSKPLFKLEFAPKNFNAPEPDAPAGWIRSGRRASMAQVLYSETAPAGQVLAIVDEDINGHAEWHSPRRPVGESPAEGLKIEWQQCYSIGFAPVKSVKYDMLLPGHYIFRLRELTLAGQRVGEELSQPLVVYPPFWQRTWAFVLYGMAATVLIFGFVRYFYLRRIRREIAILRQQQVLEAERTRIARDIHDDLGASLTHISMLSQSVTPDTATFDDLTENLKLINRATREMTQSMDEIVWAVNPKNDRLDHLVIFFDSYAQEFLASSGIEFRCDYPVPVPEHPVAAPMRHNLFMAFKEALSNAVKHAGCRTVHIMIKVSKDTLTLSLTDDGVGFVEPTSGRLGNGLLNMRRRIEDIGGRFSLESSPGKGTKVVFEVPLEG